MAFTVSLPAGTHLAGGPGGYFLEANPPTADELQAVEDQRLKGINSAQSQLAALQGQRAADIENATALTYEAAGANAEGGFDARSDERRNGRRCISTTGRFTSS